jgi:hypothetical protein
MKMEGKFRLSKDGEEYNLWKQTENGEDLFASSQKQTYKRMLMKSYINSLLKLENVVCSTTEVFTKEELVEFAQELKDYTRESHSILGHDDRDAEEFVSLYLINKDKKGWEVEVVDKTTFIHISKIIK